MNKIYLDKLCEFALTTNKNYEIINKNLNFDEIINSIKQNNSLNEKGIFFKHNFIELKSLMPSIEYDQIVLVNPLCFNLYGNIEWYNFINGLLTVLNDNYLHENNLIKKTILDTADKTYKKKIMIENILNDKIIENICSLTNIILFSINKTNIKIYNYESNKNNYTIKVVVLLNYDKEYYPVINWNNKYFNIESQFIKYLIELNNNNLNNDESNKFTQISNKKLKKNSDNFINNQLKIEKSKNIFDEFNNEVEVDVEVKNCNILNDNNCIIANEQKKIDNLINIIDDNKKVKNIVKVNEDTNKDCYNDTNKDCYEELTTNENYALYISEAIDNNSKKQINLSDSKKQINLSDSKKKSKKSKNIFVSNHIQNNDDINLDEEKQNENENENNKVESSTFVKTEKIKQKDIDEILTNIKPSLNLEQIQIFAIKLGISIFEGSTKTGKPKNIIKLELVKKIKEFAEKYKE